MGEAGRSGGEAMPGAAEAVAFDLRALPAGFQDDPYAWYRRLRAADPVYRLPDGGWFLTRWADLDMVYRDSRRFLSDKTLDFAPKFGAGSPLYRHHTTSLVFNDPPLHTRVRRLLAPAFTPRGLELLQPRFEAMVERLLDRAVERGGMDVVADFAAALPVEIIGEMLAIPAEERQPLRGWSLDILGALEAALPPDAVERGNRAVVDFADYLARHVERYRRRAPDGQGQVLGLLLAPGADGDRLSPEELVQNCIFLLNAGHETTTNLIGNGIALLHDWPEQQARLRAAPERLPSAVEEMLRFESSNQLGNRRAGEAVEIGGRRIAAGDMLWLCIGGANRDPERFAEPDRFDVARAPNRHLAFGGGAHVCAGNSLARMEGRIAIGRFLARVPRFELSGSFRRGGRARFRGYLSYPVRFA